MEKTITDELTDYRYFVNQNPANTPTSILYVNYFFNEASNGKKMVWNWWPFLFGPFWFFTRKLYISSILFLALACIFYYLSLAIYFICLTLMPSFLAGIIKYIVLVIPLLVMGVSANHIYYLKFLKLEKKAPKSRRSRNEFFAKKGGVSKINLIVSLVIIFGGLILSFYQYVI